MTQAPQMPPPVPAVTVSREYLRVIAQKQKGLLICILAYLALIVAQYTLPKGAMPILGLAAFAVTIIAVVFMFMLATKVYSTGLGILLGILTLIPLVGLIVLLIVSAKTTKILKSNGIKVGLLGAETSKI